MDLRFAHMHKQFSHSIVRSFESLSAVIYTQHPQGHRPDSQRGVRRQPSSHRSDCDHRQHGTSCDRSQRTCQRTLACTSPSCARQRVSVSACQRVSVSACQRVSVSACQRVSVSACQRVSASACQRVSVSACQRVSVSACQRVSALSVASHRRK